MRIRLIMAIIALGLSIASVVLALVWFDWKLAVVITLASIAGSINAELKKS